MTKDITRRKVADKTRDRIIKASRKLFAESGFSGTTTLSIAKAAKVNEMLIFHHFKNKATLWKKVKASIVEKVVPLNPTPISLRFFLEEIFSQRIAAYKDNPNLVRILQWQYLEKKQQRLTAGNILAPTNWVAPILHLQKLGQINPDIDPGFIIIWLTASINTIVFDNVYSNDEKKQRKYINFLITEFEKVLKVVFQEVVRDNLL